MQIFIAGVDRSYLYTPAEMETISVTQMAMDAELGQGTAVIVDPDGTLEPYAGQSLKLVSAGVTVFDGFVGAVNRTRGDVAPSGTRIVHTVNTSDENALLDGHRGVRQKRPKETDVKRMKWAINHYLDYLELDTSWVLDTHAKKVAAKTYTTEDVFGELQVDCGGPSGKTLYIENRQIHWHLTTEGPISDFEIVGPGEGGDGISTFELQTISPPIRTKDPMDLASSVMAVNDKGQKYNAIDDVATGRYDAAGVRHYRLIEAGSADLEEMQDLAEGELSQRNREHITFEGTLGPLTPEQTTHIPPGSRIMCTSPVWGLDHSTQRIAQRTLRYRHPDKWLVDLSLNYPVRTHARGSGGAGTPGAGGIGGGAGVPPPYVPGPTVYPDYHVPSCPSGDPSIVATAVALGDYSGTQSGGHSTEGLQFFDGATYHVTLRVHHATTNFECSVTTGMKNGSNLIGPFGVGHDPAIGGGQDPDPATTSLHEFDYVGIPGDLCFTAYLGEGGGYAGCNIIGSTVTYSAVYVSGPDSRFSDLTPVYPDPPTEGQQVIGETATVPAGGTTVGHTAVPYVAGSLAIKGNGVQLQSGVDFFETDPHLGIYTFAHLLDERTELSIDYQAAGAPGSGSSLPGGTGGDGGTITPPDVTPPTPTTGHGSGFAGSVLLVQGETAAGYARMVSSGMIVGQHYAGFGPACDGSNAASRLHQADGVGKILDAALAPTDLDIHRTGCAGSNSRIDPTKIATFASRINTMLAGDSEIFMVTFWNELKGYYNSAYPGSWDMPAFCTDYIAFATAIKAAHPGILMAGPYSTGQNGQNEDAVYRLDERLRYIHQYFIDHVITPHPTLVDVIAWDHGDGTKHRSYTKFYADRGVTLPHIDTEWYPNGTPGTVSRILLDMATNPLMRWCLIWGSGTDGAQVDDLWNSAGTPTPTFLNMKKVYDFTIVGGAHNTAAGVWTNGAGKTCTVSGDTVTVTP